MRDPHYEPQVPYRSAAAHLRVETRQAHLAAERTSFATLLLSGSIRLEAYVTQLVAYAALHESLEETFDALPPLRGRLPARRSEMARSDVLSLGGSLRIPDELDGALAAFREATRASRGLPTILGHAYVMEGSALGSLSLVPRIRSALGLPDASMRFYIGLGHDTFPAWARFRAFLDATLPIESVPESAAAAQHAFEIVRIVLEALEPPLGHPSTRPLLTSSGAP